MKQALLVLTLGGLLCLPLFQPAVTHAQHSPMPTVAQVGAAWPLPVYVVNSSSTLPDGFVAGSSWRFTTWTMPNITWTTTVERTEGGWAILTVQQPNAPSTSGWYYISQMPGWWQKQ